MSNTCCGREKVKIEGVFRCLQPNCPVEARRTRKRPNGFGPRAITDEDRQIFSRIPALPDPKAPTWFDRNSQQVPRAEVSAK